jgi:hypothetical protein
MVISSESCKNIRGSIALFDKAKDYKIVSPPPITCRGEGSAMFERLDHKSNGTARPMKWEFEVKGND